MKHDRISRVFLNAEEAEYKKIRARALRVARTIGTVETSTPASDRLARGLEIATKHARDGTHGTGRLDAKFRPIHATHYEGDHRVTGALVKLQARIAPDLGRKQAKVRGSQVAAGSRADQLSNLRAQIVASSPGGAEWRRCTNRAAKRSCRGRVRALQHMIEDGEF
jgi:hypothetical protein